MTERTKSLEKFLEERAEGEVTKMTAVLSELDRVIRKELAEQEPVQLLFEWTSEEKAQRDRDLGALRRRLEEIPSEIQREAENLRARFRNPTARLFPVAVTYLIPERAIVELRGGRT